MKLRGRDILIGAIVLALVAAGVFVWGLQTGWNTARAEVVVERVEVPVFQTVEVPQIVEKEVLVEVEKPCVVSCPCIEPPCVEPCKPCGVPEVPTVIPKPTPTPKEAVCPSEHGYHELKPSETWTVPACWTCLGDIKVEGKALYDNRAETGLVVYFTVPTSIYAEWGADCRSGDLRHEKEAEALQSGCGLSTGCEKVHIYVWPKDPPTN